MGSLKHSTRTMAIADAGEALSSVVAAVSRNEARVILEQDGSPVAAIISTTDLERLTRYERARAERFAIIDELREAFKDVPDEEIEREADRAVAEIRGKIPATV
jgi:PHD/YefM family antitoxin component YafN of YafNO toxin-antitoxin module